MRCLHLLPFVLAITGVEPAAVSTKPTPSATGPVQTAQTSPPIRVEAPPTPTCTFTTTTYAASYSSMFNGQLTQSYCVCQEGMNAGIGYMTSASSTSSYCQTGPPPSPWVQIPKPTPKQPMPSPSPPSCYDLHTKNWAAADDMAGAIKAFCEDAAAEYKPSDISFVFSSKTITYQSSKFNMSLYIPATNEYTFTEDDCVNKMSTIQNDCSNDPLGNPMGWKYGGQLNVGSASFIIGVFDERYVYGRCRIHMRETWQTWDLGNSDPKINCEMFDASDYLVYNTGGSNVHDVSGDNNATFPGTDQPPYYYDYLVIRSAQQHLVLNLTLGSQTWLTTTQSKNPVEPCCNIGDRGSQPGAVHSYADIDCWVSC